MSTDDGDAPASSGTQRAQVQANVAIWHNPAVAKTDPYVGELLRAHLQAGSAELAEAHLVGIDLRRADLHDVDLHGADLRDADLRDADLRGADLRAACLRRTDLQRARLERADLRQADLSQAHFGEADLREAKLDGARIDETVLKSADLRHSTLADANLHSFAWNRLTRFAGISGIETLTDSGDDAVTARFAAPIALGEHDISGTRRHRSAGVDHELTRTRTYRISEAIADDSLIADADEAPRVARNPTDAAAAAPAPMLPTGPGPRWIAVLVLAVLVAITGTGFGVWGLWQSRHRPAPIIAQPDPVDRQPVGLTTDEAEIRSYQARIAELTANGKQAHIEIKALEAQLRQAQGDVRDIRRLNQRLATETDDLLTVDQHNTELTRALEDEKLRNKRLEDTARILAGGVSELRGANTELQETVYTQVQDHHRLQELTRQVDVMKLAQKRREEELDAARRRNQELEDDLRVAERSLGAIQRTIQGTALESLLGVTETDAPLVAIEPGHTVTLGGDYLLSLTVDRGKRPQTLAIDMVLQAPPEVRIPEMNVVLYGEAGEPIRKLGASFPSDRNSNGFASFSAEISCDQFPTSARLLLAPGLEAVPPELSSAP